MPPTTLWVLVYDVSRERTSYKNTDMHGENKPCTNRELYHDPAPEIILQNRAYGKN